MPKIIQSFYLSKLVPGPSVGGTVVRRVGSLSKGPGFNICSKQHFFKRTCSSKICLNVCAPRKKNEGKSNLSFCLKRKKTAADLPESLFLKGVRTERTFQVNLLPLSDLQPIELGLDFNLGAVFPSRVVFNVWKVLDDYRNGQRKQT